MKKLRQFPVRLFAGGLESAIPASLMTDRGRLRKVLAATVLGSSLVFLDSTIANVLLPALRRDFSLSLSDARWVTQSYLLFLSALLLFGGNLGDHVGRKRVFKVGILAFSLSSLACAVAPTLGVLLVARSIQGVAGALLTPGSLAIINATFPKAERGRAIGAWASLTTLATAAGPIVGGFLVDHFSWRWAFVLNLPFAFAAWHFARVAVPESCSEKHSLPLDIFGAALVSVSFLGLAYGLMQNRVAIALGALALFVIFLFYEKRAKSPMLPLELFRNRIFSVVNGLTFFVYGALSLVLFILPFQMIEVNGFSAWQAGAAGFPLIASVFLLSRPAGALLDQFGPGLPLTAGPAIVSAGIWFLRMRALPHASYLDAYFFPMLILGIGLAITITPLTTTVMSAVDETYSGTASGVNNTVARLSGLLAIAILPVFIAGVFGISFRADLECYRATLSSATGLALAGALCGAALFVPF
jgi:EmrB/QacA subfamily drug resistance transporter